MLIIELITRKYMRVISCNGRRIPALSIITDTFNIVDGRNTALHSLSGNLVFDSPIFMRILR